MRAFLPAMRLPRSQRCRRRTESAAVAREAPGPLEDMNSHPACDRRSRSKKILIEKRTQLELAAESLHIEGICVAETRESILRLQTRQQLKGSRVGAGEPFAKRD